MWSLNAEVLTYFEPFFQISIHPLTKSAETTGITNRMNKQSCYDPKRSFVRHLFQEKRRLQYKGRMQACIDFPSRPLCVVNFVLHMTLRNITLQVIEANENANTSWTDDFAANLTK